MKIDKDITIEALVSAYPKSVGFLMRKGIHCMACGEPVWGTLEEQANNKGISAAELDSIIVELDEFLKLEGNS